MERNFSFSNEIGLSEELVPILVDNWACEYASLKKNGTPITIPLLSFPGEDGRTIDITTGLAYPSKAERARNNPKVCLLYSDPRATEVENPPVVLVYGHATVYDSDIQANTDRYVQTFLPRSKGFNKMPRFILGWMRSYFARIWIAVTPLKVLWWPEANMENSPQIWRAPTGTQAPPSDLKPEPLSTAHKSWLDSASDWRKDISYAFDKLGSPVLTVVDEEGYPVPFRVKSGSLESDGVRLELSPAMSTDARGARAHVLSNLEEQGITWLVNDRYQAGFDVTIIKNGLKQHIEVKSRGIGEYSGIINESDTQKKYPRRHFNFSDPQVSRADYFICVFVGPKKRTAIVVPKDDFHYLESKVKGRITAIEGSPLIKNRKREITKWIGAWHLIIP